MNATAQTTSSRTDAAIQGIRREKSLLIEALGERYVARDVCHCPDPAHEDRNPSGSIYQGDDGAWRVKCFSCGLCEDVFGVRAVRTGRRLADVLREARANGLARPGMARPAGNGTKRRKAHPTRQRAEQAAAWSVGQDKGALWLIAHRYEYTEDFTMLRFEPAGGGDKTCKPIHRNGDGWCVGDPAGLLPLYRGNDLTDGPVCVFEGEPVVEAARSIGILNAITSAHGSKSARRSDWPAVAAAGRVFYIFPDNDPAGEQYAQEVAAILLGLGCTIHIVRLPGLPESGDLADWIVERDAIEPDAIRAEIKALVEAAPKWAPAVEGEADGGEDERHGDLILDPSDPLTTAREFVEREFSTADGLRTLHALAGDFVTWAGSHYVVTSEASIRAKLYRFTDRAHRIEGKGDDEQIVPFKPTKAKIDNALDALRAEAHVDATMPSWIGDTDGPDPAECVATKTGILHVPTRRLYPPSPKFLNANAVTFAYEPTAPEPAQWIEFLLSVWPEDEQARSTLQEIFGLLLTLDTRHEKIFLIVGPKRSGKGTIARVLRAMLGEANVCGPTLSGLASHFGLQPLIGKQAAIITDARLGGSTDQAVIAERLLSISGEDALNVPRKNRTDWEGRLRVRFIVSTNVLPRITDASGALASRFVVLTMNKTFYGMEDHDLTDKLLAELPGIFNWSLAGLDRLRERGRFVTPESSIGAVGELEALGSPVGAFVRDCCIVEPGRSIETRELFRAWCDWCKDEGRDNSGTHASFGRDLAAAVPGVCKSRPTVGGHRIQFYEGITVNG